MWYGVGAALTKIPYVAVVTLTMVSVFFPLADFGTVEFFGFWLHTTIYALMMTYLDMFLAYAVPSVEVATAFGMISISIFFFFIGFNPPASTIPSAYDWLYQITPLRYTLEALVVTVFGNCESSDPAAIACAILQSPTPTVPQGLSIAQYLGASFNMRHEISGAISPSSSAAPRSSRRLRCSPCA